MPLLTAHPPPPLPAMSVERSNARQSAEVGQLAGADWQARGCPATKRPMPSFDVVSRVDLQEVDNALNQTRKEVAQRYDLKDSKTDIDWDQKEITITSADDF